MQVALDDENLVVSFMLPKGAFATTVIRELTKSATEAEVDAENMPAIEDEE
jgi:tRNA(Glu) U13 pseudouridine synthase TruD